MALTFAAQSTRWLKPGLQVQSEYPILQATNEAITLGGSPAFQVQTRFSGTVKRVMDGKGQLIYRSGNAKGGLVYVQGGETLRFS